MNIADAREELAPNERSAVEGALDSDAKEIGAGHDGDEDAEDMSVAFLEEIFFARCRDLGIAASDEAYHRFEMVLERKVCGSSFNLQQNGIGPHAVAVIARWLAEDDQFTRIDLAKNSIGDDGASAIARLLHRNPYLMEVDLRSNDIGPKGFVDIAHGLARNASIVSLDLSTETGFHKNVCGEKGGEAFATILKSNKTIRRLVLAGVGSAGLSALTMNGVRHSTSLRTLDLRLNHIGDDSIFGILAPLQQSVLEELLLARNSLTDLSTPAILELIKNSKSLKTLDLSWNSFSKPFGTGLRAVLQGPITLQHLFLDGNPKIGTQKGANPIFEGLVDNQSLKTLSMARCNVKDCLLVARMIRRAPALVKLVLHSNHIGDEGTVSIAKALSKNATLCVLDLSSNSITDVGGLQLALMLEQNTNLQELQLKDNNMTDSTAEKMLNVVRQRNSTISRLSLQLNGISMKQWLSLEEALRHNKANVRAQKILTYHQEVEQLQREEREIREKVRSIEKELVFNSPELAFAEVRRASESLNGFRAAEEKKTSEMKKEAAARSLELRASIKELNTKREELESEFRRMYRGSIQTTHKLDVKIGVEQRKKGTSFRTLRSQQKLMRDKDEVRRGENLLLDALNKQLKDEEGARNWLQDAVHKWSKKLEKLSTQVVAEYSRGIQTYLETLIPPPTKTNRIKQRWQRVKERRHHLLLNFNSDAFFEWFHDPTRPEPIMPQHMFGATSSANEETDGARGFAIHVKVATSPDMLDQGASKLIHGSHSVYTMSLHEQGQLSSLLVGLHDQQLALEFKTFRADVSHVVVRAAGHTKMDELRQMIAEKIGVDEADISGLYYPLTPGEEKRKRKRVKKRRASVEGGKAGDEPAKQTIEDADASNEDEEDIVFDDDEIDYDLEDEANDHGDERMVVLKTDGTEGGNNGDVDGKAAKSHRGRRRRRRGSKPDASAPKSKSRTKAGNKGRQKTRDKDRASKSSKARKAAPEQLAATPGSALKQVQEMFPIPESDSDEFDDDYEDDEYDEYDDSRRSSLKTGIPPHAEPTHSRRRSSKDSTASHVSGDDNRQSKPLKIPKAEAMQRRGSDPGVGASTNAGVAEEVNAADEHQEHEEQRRRVRHAHRRSSLPSRLMHGDSSAKSIRRQFTQLMSWNLYHSQRPMPLSMGTPATPAALTQAATPSHKKRTLRELNPNLELDPDVADSLEEAEAAADDVWESAEAQEQRLRQELAQTETNLGNMHPAVSSALLFLSAHCQRHGQYEEAEKALTRARMIREKAFGRRHPHVATVIQSLADLYCQQERLDEAEPLYVKALNTREKTLGKQNPVLAETLTSLGRLYQRKDDYDRAEPLYVRALTIRERIYGKRHPQVLESLQDISRLYTERSRIQRQRKGGAGADGDREDNNDELRRTVTGSSTGGFAGDSSTAESADNHSSAAGAAVRSLGAGQDSYDMRQVNTKVLPDNNPAYKLDEAESMSAGAAEVVTLSGALRPSFRPVTLRSNEAINVLRRGGQDSLLPASLRGMGARDIAVDDFDFRDAVTSASVPSHWITRRRMMSVRPWNKLVSLSTRKIPRVQLQSQQLHLTLNNGIPRQKS